MKKSDTSDPFRIRVCECGKNFIPTHEYVYKIYQHNYFKYYCSYSCWRKAGGGNAKKTFLTKGQPKDR